MAVMASTALCGCGGQTQLGDGIGPGPITIDTFVGAWTCATTVTSPDAGVSGSVNIPTHGTVAIHFVLDSDAGQTLTMVTGDPDASDGCALALTVSGSTATAISGQDCFDVDTGMDNAPVLSDTFVIARGVATWTYFVLEPPSRSVPYAMTGLIVGSCTKN